MDRSLFNKSGEAVACLADDYHQSIYLWDGYPVAYLYNEQHVYGINGRHLGWFIDEIIFNNSGERIGFTSGSCPVTIAKEPIKGEKHSMDQIRSRWRAPPLPKLSFSVSNQELADFLREGQVRYFRGETSPEESEESED